MITSVKENLWKNFGASIDMLKNSIVAWPEDRWETEKRFFYVAYHTVVFLDYYLTIPAQKFPTALPYFIGEATDAVDDIIPQRIYSKTEIIEYLHSVREKCRAVVGGLTEEGLNERWIEVYNGGRNFAFFDLLLYNMRHVQHHTAQLNLILRQNGLAAPDWVSAAKDNF